jgi:hypothetical protein
LFNEETIARNSKGIIQKIIFKDEQLIQSGVDSFIINVHYDESLSQYTSRVDIIDYGFEIWRDSVTFSYDANGEMVTLTYFTDNGTGSYHPGGKADYTYAGNNMATVKLFSYNSGAYEEDFTVTSEYDAKTSPLILGNEAFIIDYQGLGDIIHQIILLKQTATYPATLLRRILLLILTIQSNLPATSTTHSHRIM